MSRPKSFVMPLTEVMVDVYLDGFNAGAAVGVNEFLPDALATDRSVELTRLTMESAECVKEIRRQIDLRLQAAMRDAEGEQGGDRK